MTDTELLELAAKACGFKKVSATYHSDDDGCPTSEFWYMHVKDLYDGNSGSSCVWNPLTDDGDALRLAVKLRLRVEINERSVVVYWIADESEKSVYEYPDSVQNADYEIQHINQDKATRRAIVRAAAEIGKEMK